MFVDFVINGEGCGPVAEAVVGCHYDPGYMRPYFDYDGTPKVTVNAGRKLVVNQETGVARYEPTFEEVALKDLHDSGIFNPVWNATSLRKDEWIRLDTIVLEAARSRLRAWSDLMAASPYGGFDGMSKTLLEHETQDDPGEALVDMDGLTESRSDEPRWQLEGVPLPITHSGFWFGKRRLAVSRNTGQPLDTNMAEKAGRRVAEMVEKTLIGEATGITFGTAANYSNSPRVWGYTNYTDRITKTDLTTPTGTNPADTLADVLAMRDLLYAANFYGPFMLYHSNDWDQFMDNDYYTLSTTGATTPSSTLRNRLRAIEGIQDVRRLDFLTSTNNPYTLIMVQMTSDVAQAVNGMDITTVQWETMGGMKLHFKVMAIHVPRLRSDYNGNCGICHATPS